MLNVVSQIRVSGGNRTHHPLDNSLTHHPLTDQGTHLVIYFKNVHLNTCCNLESTTNINLDMI